MFVLKSVEVKTKHWWKARLGEESGVGSLSHPWTTN
jgi:hypothetical protein